ncbi:serine hydrolase [Lacibacter sp. MH-610]|uniref:serine hydrolase domain-containing protein n=1 Tax=Lacibacter sp. MH-610 TaxID=3020883 RepID=UPI0038929054
MTRTYIFFLLLMISVNKGFSQFKARQLDTLMQTFFNQHQFNGAVLVAEKGAVIYKKGWGLANMEWKIPNTPGTRFRIGSVTKPFTALLVMQLVEKGAIQLNAPFVSYLPQYPSKNGERITIHHLLTHSSGIPDYANFSTYENFCRDAFSKNDFVKIFADSSLEFQPGERFSYSNSNYFLLGMILENITGKTYQQLLQEKILSPLNMINTGYDEPETILHNRAAGYEKKEKEYMHAPYLNINIPYAAGAMYSTVEDLFLWEQALRTNRLLKKETMEQVFEKHIPSFAHFHYGYGWLTGKQPIGHTNDSIPVIFHSGDINGFTSLFMRLPSSNSLIVLINNTGGAPLFDISNGIIAILNNKPYSLPKE